MRQSTRNREEAIANLEDFDTAHVTAEARKGNPHYEEERADLVDALVEAERLECADCERSYGPGSECRCAS